MARKKWTAQQMLEQVREVAAEVGPRVTLREFLADSGVPESQIRRQFGTWEALRREAGLSPADRDRRRISDEDLFQEYFRLYRQLGRLPSARELDRLGRFAARTYYVRFGRRRDLKRALYDWLRHLDSIRPAAVDSAADAPREKE